MNIETPCCIATPPIPPTTTRTDTPTTTSGTAIKSSSSKDSGTKTDHAGSGFYTLDPYEPHAPVESQPHVGSTVEATNSNNTKNKPQRRRKRQAKAIPQQQLTQLVGTNSETWTRFHVLNFNEDTDNPKPNGMSMWTDLHSKLKDEFTCTRRSDGSVLVDAKTKENAEELEKISHICNTSITSSRDLQMNSTRATVLVPESEFNNSDEIESCLLAQCEAQGLPVSSVKHIEIKSRKSKRILHLARLIFESRTIPDYIYVGFEKVKVREDLPRPRQCQNCWKFGHPAEICRASPCCPICSSVYHQLESCTFRGDQSFRGRCLNCNEVGHTAFSKQCDLY